MYYSFYMYNKLTSVPVKYVNNVFLKYVLQITLHLLYIHSCLPTMNSASEVRQKSQHMSGHDEMLYFDYNTVIVSGVFTHSCWQHVTLPCFQESCVNLFYKLSAVNQGAVWLKLLCMWSPIQQLNLPADGLQTVKVIMIMIIWE